MFRLHWDSNGLNFEWFNVTDWTEGYFVAEKEWGRFESGKSAIPLLN